MNMFTEVKADDGLRRNLRLKLANRPLWQRAGLIGTPLVALAAAVTLWNSDPSPAAAPPLPSVTVAAPLEQNVSLWDDYVGRFEPSRSVEVRPRVSGQIVAVHFTDGAIVQKGQLLFTIDPRPFTAALAEARAGVATARSELNLAETNLGRARRLLEADAVSQANVDQLTAQVQTARAALAAAQARVQQRALDVEFTRIRAPISGRISDRKIDAGNLVVSGVDGGTLLTTINALDPIYFTFDVPESLYLKDSRERRAGAQGEVAEIRLQDEATYNWRGKLDFTDNGISQNSGTIRARAVVRNPDLFLTPGMFGNMRLADGGTTPALLVPDAAIRTDQARKIVLTVGKDGTVAAKPVETGPLVGDLRVIRSGLTRADRVVIQGVQFAMPGSKVKPRVTQVRVAEGAAPAAAPPSSPSASQATLAAR
jgi:RND family efflux transporter MFP subunit